MTQKEIMILNNISIFLIEKFNKEKNKWQEFKSNNNLNKQS